MSPVRLCKGAASVTADDPPCARPARRRRVIRRAVRPTPRRRTASAHSAVTAPPVGSRPTLPRVLEQDVQFGYRTGRCAAAPVPDCGGRPGGSRCGRGRPGVAGQDAAWVQRRASWRSRTAFRSGLDEVPAVVVEPGGGFELQAQVVLGSAFRLVEHEGVGAGGQREREVEPPRCVRGLRSVRVSPMIRMSHSCPHHSKTVRSGSLVSPVPNTKSALSDHEQVWDAALGTLQLWSGVSIDPRARAA